MQQPAAAEQPLLEDDDDFEEFPKESWDATEEDNKDAELWDDNWDDDNLDDDFSAQLRAELEKGGHAASS